MSTNAPTGSKPTAPRQTTARRTKRGQVSLAVVAVVILTVVAIVVAAILRMRGEPSDSRAVSDRTVVKRGTFDIALPVSGELAALRQIEIRNRVDGRSVITEIIPEGTNVQAGDVLLRLNDDELRDRWRTVKERVNTAEASLITAEAELKNVINEREANLAKADSTIKLAELALLAWTSGTNPSKHQELKLAVETAEKDYARLEERFKESARLLERKFISVDEYKRDEISMIEARSRLARAKLDLESYEQYQSLHDRAAKESDLEQAHLDRKRIEDQYVARVQSAEIEVESKRFQLQSAQEDLNRIEQQLEYCTVVAPSAGLVVYTSSLQSGGMGRNEGRPPMVGTELSKNESVMILPDISQMVASVKVSEALSGMIRPGQRAAITADANPNATITGEVMSVGVLAESGGWRDPNRRDYTVRILLRDGYDLGLKPSMRCRAEIYVGRVSDALHVPIQSVFRNGPVNYVYVPQGRGFAQRQVTIGRASELFIEIKDGVQEGQVVLLREPAPEEIVSRLPAPKAEERESIGDIGEAPESFAPRSRGNGMQGGPPNGMPPAGAMPGGSGRMRGGDGSAPGGMGGGSGAGGGDGAPRRRPSRDDADQASANSPSSPGAASPESSTLAPAAPAAAPPSQQ